LTASDFLPGVVVEPRTEARAAVIWLHGLGADGHDFEPIVPHLGLDRLPVRFVFPHAPSRAVTINMGMIMPAWYDIVSLELGRHADREGIDASAARVRDLVRRETERGVPAERIVLGGFSQGGAVALHAGLRHPERLAGIAALSTYVVAAGSLADEAHEANRDVPIFQAHGTEDPMVPYSHGEAARDLLTELGYRVQWKSYRMAHEVCAEEILDLGAWLARRLAAAG
jgi:phospholipase/carboxylesterase